jgi:hypothetical protein
MANYLKIATEQLRRGFETCPVHPEEKHGVRWDQFIRPTTNLTMIMQHAEDYSDHNVGVVGKRGVGRLCFLDIDADGAVDQIEHETGHTIPMTYTVQSSPATKPYKRHYYFTQTQYSFTHFTKNFSRKDLTRTTLSRKNNVIHPEVYAVKGVGGGSYVVAAGCTRSDGEIYTVMHDVPVAPIPDWLIDWIRMEKTRQDSELVRKAGNRRAVVAAMSPEERTIRQAKDDESAFEVSEANIIPFIQSRASSLGNLGLTLLDRKMLEEVLTGLVKQYCAGGVAYVESEHGRRHVHDVAFSKNLPTGSAKWVELMGTRKKAKLAGMIVSKVTRVSLLRAAVETFPARIGAERAYVHLQDALAGTKFTLGKGRAAERITKRLRDWAGYDTEKTSGGWCWVRRGRDAPAHQTTTVLQTTTQPIPTY